VAVVAASDLAVGPSSVVVEGRGVDHAAAAGSLEGAVAGLAHPSPLVGAVPSVVGIADGPVAVGKGVDPSAVAVAAAEKGGCPSADDFGLEAPVLGLPAEIEVVSSEAADVGKVDEAVFADSYAVGVVALHSHEAGSGPLEVQLDQEAYAGPVAAGWASFDGAAASMGDEMELASLAGPLALHLGTGQDAGGSDSLRAVLAEKRGRVPSREERPDGVERREPHLDPVPVVVGALMVFALVEVPSLALLQLVVASWLVVASDPSPLFLGSVAASLASDSLAFALAASSLQAAPYSLLGPWTAVASSAALAASALEVAPYQVASSSVPAACLVPFDHAA